MTIFGKESGAEQMQKLVSVFLEWLLWSKAAMTSWCFGGRDNISLDL